MKDINKNSDNDSNTNNKRGSIERKRSFSETIYRQAKDTGHTGQENSTPAISEIPNYRDYTAPHQPPERAFSGHHSLNEFIQTLSPEVANKLQKIFSDVVSDTSSQKKPFSELLENKFSNKAKEDFNSNYEFEKIFGSRTVYDTIHAYPVTNMQMVMHAQTGWDTRRTEINQGLDQNIQARLRLAPRYMAMYNAYTTSMQSISDQIKDLQMNIVSYDQTTRVEQIMMDAQVQQNLHTAYNHAKTSRDNFINLLRTNPTL
jgi:hypothetical protein